MPLFRTPTGKIVTLSQEEAGSAAANGYEPVAVGSAGLGTEEAPDTGELGGLLAGITGGLSGASLGLSDLIGSQFASPGQRGFVQQSREQHPITTGAAQFAGALIPSLAAPGSGLATTPAGATASLGRTIIESAAPEGTGLLGRTAAHAIGAGAEGALYGGGDYLSQMALEDKPLSAEGFVGAMGYGALFGAPIGAGMSLGGAALQRASSLFPRREVSAAAASGIARDATASLKQAVDDGDQMMQAAQRRIALTDSKIGLAEHGEQATRDIFGEAHPQAITDQALGGVDSAQLKDALQKYQASKDQLTDWIRTAGDPDLESILGDLQVPEVQKIQTRRSGVQWPPEPSESTIGAGEAGFGADQATSAGGRRAAPLPVEPSAVPDSLLASVREPESFSPSPAADVTRQVRGIGKGTPPQGVPSDLLDQVNIPSPAKPAEPLSNEEFDSFKNDFRHSSKKEHFAAGMYYSKNGDFEINGALRGGRVPHPDDAKAIADLDDALTQPETAIQRDTTLYRGLSGKWAEEHFAEMKPGQVFEDPGYLSTAHNADSKVRNESVVFNIHTPAGVHGVPIPSKYSSEREILLGRGTRLRVDSNELKPYIPTDTRWKSSVGHEVNPDKSVTIEFNDGSKHTYPPYRELNVTIINDHAPPPKIEKLTDEQLISGPLDQFSKKQLRQHQDALTREMDKAGRDTPRYAELGKRWDEAVGFIHGDKFPTTDYRGPSQAVAEPGDLEGLLRGTKAKIDEGAALNKIGTEHPAYEKIDIGTPARPAGRGPHNNYEASAMAADERAAQGAANTFSIDGTKLSMVSETKPLIHGGTPRTYISVMRTLSDGEIVPIATAEFVNRDNTLHPEHVTVDPAWQRKGIATRMYDMAERKSGKRVIASDTQTPEGAAFSRKYRSNRDVPSADERVARGAASEAKLPSDALGAIRQDFKAQGLDLLEGSTSTGGIEDLKKLMREHFAEPPIVSGVPKTRVEPGMAAEMGALHKENIGKTIVERDMRTRMKNLHDDQKIAELLSKHDGNNVDIGPDIAKAAKVIGDYERDSADLVEILGSDAPASAQANAKGYREAVGKQSESQAVGSNRLAGDISSKVSPAVEHAAGGKAGSALGKMADLGTALEVLHALGVHTPALSAIPVIGPILGLFLKARAVMKMIGRRGGSVAKSADGSVAARSAELQNRIATATGAMLATGGKGAKKLSAIIAGPAVTLTTKLFPGDGDTKSKDLQVLYEARSNELAHALQPGAIAHAVGDRLKVSDPLMQDAITSQIERGLKFIESKRPKQTFSPGMLPGDGAPKISKVLLDEWGKYIHAVNDPASVIEDLAKGHLSIEGAETLHVVYPNLFLKAQQVLLDHAAEFKKTLPYTRRVALSIAYQIPVDGTMTQSHMMFLQPPPTVGTVPQTPGQSPGMPSSTPAIIGPLKIGTQTMTSLDRRAGA